MSLTNFTGTVALSTLRANFDDKTTALTSQAVAGQKDQTIPLFVPTLTSATLLRDRSVAITPQDDMEVRMLFARGTADAAARTLKAVVTVDNGDTEYVVEQTIDAEHTSAGAGTLDTRSAPDGDFRTTTSVRVRLLKGVRYRFAVECTTAGTFTDVAAALQLRSRRRAA